MGSLKALPLKTALTTALISMALALALAAPAMAQSTEPINQTSEGTQTPLSPQGCEDGGFCTSELVGDARGNQVNNLNGSDAGAGFRSNFSYNFRSGSDVVSSSGEGTFRAFNLDTITFEATGNTIFDRESGSSNFQGTFSIINGTGEFSGARGSGSLNIITDDYGSTDDGSFTAYFDSTIISPHAAPVANDDTATTPEDKGVVVDVLDNDTDTDSMLDTQSVSVTNQPQNGTTTVNDDGAITYNPNADFNGTDTFTYEVCDKGVPRLCDTVTVTVTITPVGEGEPNPNACTIRGTEMADTLEGTSARDVICGFGGSDTIGGLGGNDVIRGGDGRDSIRGNDGNDKLYGQDGGDTVSGGDGNDTLRGGSGSDTVVGGSGSDTTTQR